MSQVENWTKPTQPTQPIPSEKFRIFFQLPLHLGSAQQLCRWSIPDLQLTTVAAQDDAMPLQGKAWRCFFWKNPAISLVFLNRKRPNLLTKSWKNVSNLHWKFKSSCAEQKKTHNLKREPCEHSWKVEPSTQLSRLLHYCDVAPPQLHLWLVKCGKFLNKSSPFESQTRTWTKSSSLKLTAKAPGKLMVGR